MKPVGQCDISLSPIMAAVGMSSWCSLADGRGSTSWCSSVQASGVMVGKQNTKNAKPGNQMLSSSVGIMTLQQPVQ